MTMVRIVRTDGEPNQHDPYQPYPLAGVCKMAKIGRAPRNRYQVEFVEPVPLFDVVMYRTTGYPAHLVCEKGLELSIALQCAAEKRVSASPPVWRTVVRAAR